MANETIVIFQGFFRIFPLLQNCIFSWESLVSSIFLSPAIIIEQKSFCSIKLDIEYLVCVFFFKVVFFVIWPRKEIKVSLLKKTFLRISKTLILKTFKYFLQKRASNVCISQEKK